MKRKGTANEISKDSPIFRYDSLPDWKAKDFLSRDTENSCKQRRLVKSRKYTHIAHIYIYVSIYMMYDNRYYIVILKGMFYVGARLPFCPFI